MAWLKCAERKKKDPRLTNNYIYNYILDADSSLGQNKNATTVEIKCMYKRYKLYKNTFFNLYFNVQT